MRTARGGRHHRVPIPTAPHHTAQLPPQTNGKTRSQRNQNNDRNQPQLTNQTNAKLQARRALPRGQQRTAGPPTDKTKPRATRLAPTQHTRHTHTSPHDTTPHRTATKPRTDTDRTRVRDPARTRASAGRHSSRGTGRPDSPPVVPTAAAPSDAHSASIAARPRPAPSTRTTTREWPPRPHRRPPASAP